VPDKKTIINQLGMLKTDNLLSGYPFTGY